MTEPKFPGWFELRALEILEKFFAEVVGFGRFRAVF
jgi:hypothetical protein